MFDDNKIGVWRYTPTIMDGPVVRFDWDDRFEINASRNGVSMSGPAPVLSRRFPELLQRLNEANEAHQAIGKHGDHDAAKRIYPPRVCLWTQEPRAMNRGWTRSPSQGSPSGKTSFQVFP